MERHGTRGRQRDPAVHDRDEPLRERVVEDGVARAVAPARFDGFVVRARPRGNPFEELVEEQYRRVYAPWHFLYFLPEPHQQGSLRPSFCVEPVCTATGESDNVLGATPPAAAIAS